MKIRKIVITCSKIHTSHKYRLEVPTWRSARALLDELSEDPKIQVISVIDETEKWKGVGGSETK